MSNKKPYKTIDFCFNKSCIFYWIEIEAFYWNELEHGAIINIAKYFVVIIKFPKCFILPAKCPPGFTSEDGMTNCRPCGKDKYWVNATTCEDCPAGSITDVMNGVPDVEGCKGMN